MMKPPLTFIYVATGSRYLEEARRSAASCRQHVTGARIVLFTPDETTIEGFDDVIKFGQNIRDPFALKIAGIAACTEARYVYLDTDTYVLGDLVELNDLLDEFDAAAAHAPVRLQSNLWPDSLSFLTGAPLCFPEFNTGVIAVKRSTEVVQVLNAWLTLYGDHSSRKPPPRTQDQASFREVVYRSRLRVATLPPEYNCRFPYPTGLCGLVKILHGHGSEETLRTIGMRLNRNAGFRAINRDRFLAASVLIRSPTVR